MSDSPDAPLTPDAPRNRPHGRWVLLAITGGALLLAVVTIVVIIGASGSSPTDATERYLEAARDRDKARVVAAVCDDDDDDVRSLIGMVDDSDEVVEWRIVNETISGETARVHASITLANEGRTQSVAAVFSLVRVDGDWKVCGWS